MLRIQLLSKHDSSIHKKNLKYICIMLLTRRGWSGGAMVLGKLLVPGRPANLD